MWKEIMSKWVIVDVNYFEHVYNKIFIIYVKIKLDSIF